MTDVTHILNDVEDGDIKAADKLLSLGYDELRLLAAQKLSQEKSGQTLQASAFVHEAYIRLVGIETHNLGSRGHFFTATADTNSCSGVACGVKSNTAIMPASQPEQQYKKTPVARHKTARLRGNIRHRKGETK